MDYHPFGLTVTGRATDNQDYRFGFNGKENDTDFSKTQLIQDYGFRLYNPSIARFLSVDPLTKNYPSWSPYPFAMNRVIDGIDLDGLEFQPAGKPSQYMPSGITSASDRSGFEPVITPKATLSDIEGTVYEHRPNAAEVIEDYMNTPSPEANFVAKIMLAATYGAVDDAYVVGTDLLSDFNVMNGARHISGRGTTGSDVTDAGAGVAMEAFGLYAKGASSISGTYGGGHAVNKFKSNTNCAGCTIAGDATIKGRPASALNHGVTSTDDVLKMYGKKAWYRGNKQTDIINKMENLEEGATGIVFGYRGQGKVGHYFNVTKINGEVQFLDFQKQGRGKSASMTVDEVNSDFKDLWFINTTE